MKRKVQGLEQDLKQDREFAPFYMWCYELHKQDEESKYIEADVAQTLWTYLMPIKWRTLAPHFDAFVAEEIEQKELKFVTINIWKCMLDFCREVKEAGQNWEAKNDGAWPLMIDRFVDYLQKNGIWPSAL